MMTRSLLYARFGPRIGDEPGSSPWNNVLSFLELHRERSPDRPALVWAAPGESPSHESMTFAELAARAESVAAGLTRLGLRPGDRVFLFVPMSPALYVSMFAVQRLGAIAVFLDSWARRAELGGCASQVDARALIAPEQALPLIRNHGFGSVEIAVAVGSHRDPNAILLEDLAGTGDECPIASVEQKQTALVTFTTGSSGAPKGADRTHRFLAAQHDAIERSLPYGPDDVDLPVFPIFSLNNLAGGVTTVLPALDLARPREGDGNVLLEQMLATRATTCTLSPSLLRATAAAARGRGVTFGGLRRCATGGAPVRRDDVAAFESVAPCAEVHILYGSTEVEPIAHFVPTRDDGEAGEAKPDRAREEGVCVGRIVPGLDHRLVRPSREPIELSSAGWGPWEVAPGEPGELVVAGEHVCPGYYRNPEAVRFSLVRCVSMATAFFAGNALLASRLTETTLPFGAGLCGLLATVLVFFRLRIFDDIKDATRDRVEHADRPLARGLITLTEARRAAVMVAALELVLAVLVGWRAVAAWSVVLVYSVLMYREFFVGEWMRPKMELYAVTHTLVAGWLGLFVASVATSRAPWEQPAALWALAAVNWAVFNVFEFARKSWALEEERSGFASYSGRLGPTGAVALTLSQALPAVALVAWLLTAGTARALAVVAPLILAGVGLTAAVAYARAPSRAPARRYRASMTLFIVGIYVITAILSVQEG